MLSQAIEDYLKTIYKLEEKSSATTNEIARAMGVAAASVTNMLKRLAELNLVEYTSHKGVTLTEPGRKAALEIIRHHRLIEMYLHEALGYSWDKVHDEAEHLEHHISEEFEDKIAEFLGHPTHDPHGDPIPTKDGKLPDIKHETLLKTDIGVEVVVQRVPDSDSELLRYLAEIGLKPKAKVEVLLKAPFNGPITLKIAEKEIIIGCEVAEKVQVAAFNNKKNKSK
ncbi:MAG TPA: metal-dependent transcriptional regulator [Patescibacteria group bacterium]|nr:metal-dependent transcriptional regulator [Patescibacteria group bacterium]